jgi:membrane fusion protein (multidrug efflux system)
LSENERRAKLLLQKKPSAKKNMMSLAEYASMKAQSQLIKAQIAKTAVRAPFSGIGLRSISVGTYITPAILVANLVNIES